MVVGTIVILVAAAAFIGFFIYSFIEAYTLACKLSHPKRCIFRPEIKGAGVVRKFDFRSEDGLSLKGIEAVPKGEIKGTVIVCHYLGGTKEMALSFAGFLLDYGFRLVSFDFRNHGESQDDKSIRFSFERDFQGFFEALKKMRPEDSFMVLGYSIGSNIALFGMDRYREVRAAVIDSGPLIYAGSYFRYVLDERKVGNPVTRLLFLAMYLYYAGFINLAKRTQAALERLKGRPLLMIQGEKDHIIPSPNAAAAYEYVRSENAEIWMVKNSRHLTNHSVERNQYSKRVAGFFTSNLKS